MEVHRRAGGSGRDGSERLGDDGQIERELEREEVERIEWAEYVERLEGGEDEDTIVDWRRGRSWRYSGSSFFFLRGYRQQPLRGSNGGENGSSPMLFEFSSSITLEDGVAMLVLPNASSALAQRAARNFILCHVGSSEE